MALIEVPSWVFLFFAAVFSASSSPGGAAPGAARAGGEGPAGFTLFLSSRASYAEELAARELCRYLYLRTGRLPPITPAAVPPKPGAGGGFLVARKDRGILKGLGAGADLDRRIASLCPQQYLLQAIEAGGRRLLVVAGGDESGVLYGAFRAAEHLGVRFFLHGDVIPDERLPLSVPLVEERGVPLFAVRGIQPFHDFPEGPDWWDLEEYEAVIARLPRLRMNFIGLHTYPDKRPNAEPTVWIGLPGDVDAEGKVFSSYPASYQNTLRGNWGYRARKTGDFVFGGSLLFERDAYGPEVMAGDLPRPETPGACNALFDRTASMLRRAFGLARRLGVRTCVGTETPLVVPEKVRARIAASGRDPASGEVVEDLYAGIFTRLMRACPVDWYWFWTPEKWTWQGATGEEVKATLADLARAAAAAKRVKAPFRLATCGWVLGPKGDRALFDRVLPEGFALSCINRQVGMEPVDGAFKEVKRPGKWAIPWLEDDPALASPQLWVGRMREDAALALKYGCSGLIGIHWRTRAVGPNVLALARAAWEGGAAGRGRGKGTRKDRGKGARRASGETTRPPAPPEGPEGGHFAAFPGASIAGTEDDPLYRTVRWDVSAYRLNLPGGLYRVTLKFCEPFYGEKGKRVFGVKIQGKRKIDRLDIFETAGKDRALDFTFEKVPVTGGRLDIEFVKIVEFPCIAAIVVEGKGAVRKIDCGGPAYEDYAADWPSADRPGPRGLPSPEFFSDFALHAFGPAAAAGAAAILARIDDRLPRPFDWVGGPGGLKPDPRPWKEAAKDYAFVDDFAALGERVSGAGCCERFGYWLDSFRYMREAARLGCAWARMNEAMKKVGAAKDEAARRRLAREAALPAREEAVRCAAAAFRLLLGTVSTTGGLGTVANWEQHILPGILEESGKELEKALGEPLPAAARPSMEYDGPPRIIVPVTPPLRGPGKALRLKVILLAKEPPLEAELLSRPLYAGEEPGSFSAIPLEHVNRGVFGTSLPPAPSGAIGTEYYIRAVFTGDEAVLYPPTAPAMNLTVITEPVVSGKER